MYAPTTTAALDPPPSPSVGMGQARDARPAACVQTHVCTCAVRYTRTHFCCGRRGEGGRALCSLLGVYGRFGKLSANSALRALREVGLSGAARSKPCHGAHPHRWLCPLWLGAVAAVNVAGVAPCPGRLHSPRTFSWLWIWFWLVRGYLCLCLLHAPTPPHSERRLQTTRQPIRITTDTSRVNSAPALTSDQRTLLLQYMLPTALARITAALTVDPVEGPLRASRQCLSRYISTDLVGKCASYNASLPLCNTLPNVYIPENLLGSNCTDYSNVRRGSLLARTACAHAVNAEYDLSLCTR